jgi:multicomponent Na+:H+ antiporter subunit B
VNSLIARTAARALEPLLLLFSIYLLFAGHNGPGGGFVGGLVAATAFLLHALTHDAADARRLMGVEPRTLIGVGLLCSFLAAIVGLFLGRPLLTGVWGEVPVGSAGFAVGTPLLFDLGVYLVVSGVALLMVLTLAED